LTHSDKYSLCFHTARFFLVKTAINPPYRNLGEANMRFLSHYLFVKTLGWLWINWRVLLKSILSASCPNVIWLYGASLFGLSWAAVRAKLFMPMTTAKAKGQGLGLAVVKRLG
jgi:hypothetical protein